MSEIKIIISGVSSFSGAHFAYQMLEEGFEVYGFSRNVSDWTSEQDARIRWIRKKFPEFQIFDLVELNKISHLEISAILLHGGVTLDYRNKSFDVQAAVKESLEVNEILMSYFPKAAIMQTGTFSEPDESSGEYPRSSFNPYSTSKALIWQELKKRYSSKRKMAKYVMPNPFGPLESKRFTDYLLKSWAQKLVPEISFPFHVRDNVPIDLLRLHYSESVKRFLNDEKRSIFYPSKYPETVLAFAERYSREISKRSNLQLQLKIKLNSEYIEPIVRVNSEPCEWTVKNWNENLSWNYIVFDALERINAYSVIV